MTAPVTQAAVPGGMRVQFVLPKGVTLASAPEPLDPRVQLREVPASQRADDTLVSAAQRRLAGAAPRLAPRTDNSR